MSHHPDIGDPEANHLAQMQMRRSMEEQAERQAKEAERQKEQEEWDAKYPEHAKLRAVKTKADVIGQFLEWAYGEQEWEFAWVNTPDDDDEVEPIPTSIESMLARYFDIDQKRLSQEKDDILDEWRKKNKL